MCGIAKQDNFSVAAVPLCLPLFINSALSDLWIFCVFSLRRYEFYLLCGDPDVLKEKMIVLNKVV